MKKVMLLGIACAMTLACSKETPSEQKQVVKKTVPGSETEILSLVQDFESNFNSWKEGAYEPSSVDNTEMEYAVWLMEATLNYENRGNGEEGDPLYVDFSQRTIIDQINLPYTHINEEVLTSELEMFTLYDDLRITNNGKAPFTDLEIVLAASGSGIRIDATFFESVETAGDCKLEITSNMYRPAHDANSNTCHPTEDATILLNKAISWGLERRGLCGWAYNSWFHTIKNNVVSDYDPPVNHNDDFKLAYYTYPNGIPTVNLVGSGNHHYSRVWEGDYVYNCHGAPCNSNQNKRTDCLNPTKLQGWEEAAEEIIDIEEPYVDTILFSELQPWLKYNGIVTFYYHILRIKTGKAGAMPS